MRKTLGARIGAAEEFDATIPRRAESAALIADVWSKRDYLAAGIILCVVALLALGRWLALSWLTTAALVLGLVGIAVLIAWRLLRGPNPRHHHDGRV